MRWTDLPPAIEHRTVVDWCATMCGTFEADALDRVAARVAARVVGDLPVIVIAAEALRAACEHVADSALERGGLLVGEALVDAASDAEPAAVFVRAAVPGPDAAATGYSLRLNAPVWDAARAALTPSEVVVGWFHSHPDIGAFFSATDRRTQAGFFHHPFSLGWVIDPVRREQAWFVGPRSKALPADAVLTLATLASSPG
jgi:proteasome lid subunit RPN8/RPN11